VGELYDGEERSAGEYREVGRFDKLLFGLRKTSTYRNRNAYHA
jgi:hypothetical protein